MATPRTRIELRRGSDLALIVSAIEGACPTVPADAIGLADEWDLERDALSAQSDACVRCIARFLR